MTSPSVRPDATAVALAWASSPASSVGVPAVNALSSTPLTTTSGSSPAARSTASRAGEPDASTIVVTRPDPTGGKVQA